MKSITTLFFLVLMSSLIFSQDYIPLVDENKSWVISKYEGIANPIDPLLKGGNVHHLSGDTIVNNKNYKKLYSRQLAGNLVPCGPPPNIYNCFVYEIPYRITSQTLIGLLREDLNEQKVYYCFEDCEQSEIILYDFSLELGDTLNPYLFESITQGWPEFTGTVENVTTEFLYGRNRRVLHTIGFGIWLSGDQHESLIKIVEGIGILNLGLFNVAERELRDYCEGAFSECGITITAISELDLQNSIIGPNPASEIIRISTDFEIHDLDLLNLTGQVIYTSGLVQQTIYEMNISNFPNGVYFLNIRDTNGHSGTRKLIIAR